MKRYLITYTIQCVAAAKNKKEAEIAAHSHLEDPPILKDESNAVITIVEAPAGPTDWPVIGDAQAYVQQG